MRKDWLAKRNMLPILGIAAALCTSCSCFTGETGPDTALLGTPHPLSKVWTSPSDANNMIEKWCQASGACQPDSHGFPAREISGMDAIWTDLQVDFDYEGENGENVPRRALVWVMKDNGDEDYDKLLFTGQAITWIPVERTESNGRGLEINNLFASLTLRLGFEDDGKLKLSFIESEDDEGAGGSPVVAGEKEIDWTPKYGVFILTDEGGEANGIFLRINDGKIEIGEVEYSE